MVLAGLSGTADAGSYATDFTTNPGLILHQNGPSTTAGIGIGFDAYQGAGANDVIGISIRVDGQLKHTVPLPFIGVPDTDPDYRQSLQTEPSGVGVSALKWEKFKVDLRLDGTIDVFWKGEKVIDNVQTDFTPTVGRRLFGARTGGLNQAHHFDNLTLNTVLAPIAAVTDATLKGGLFTFKVSDFDTQSVVTPQRFSYLLIDGFEVTPTSISKSGTVTTVIYQSPTTLPLNSANSYAIELEDQNRESIFSSGSLRTLILPPASLISDEPVLNQWNIREIRGGTVSGGIPLNTAVAIAMDPPVQTDPPTPAIRTDNYSAPFFNISDPNSSGGRGFFRRDANIRTDNYIAANTDDNNIVALGKTRIQVPETGVYTFRVQSDDGFPLRINGASFTKALGTAGFLIDPADPSTLAFTIGTGNSSTRGAIELTAGVEYLIDFLWFENDIPFPSNTAVDDNHFATVACYQFQAVPGDYTMGVTSDDGFALRVLGGPYLINSGGPGGVDPLDGRAFFNPGASGDQSFGTYRVTEAGTYMIELVSYEGSGGSSLEVVWAAGNFTARGATASSQLIGDPADASLPPLVKLLPDDLFSLLPLAPAGQWSTRFTYSTTALGNLDVNGFAAMRNPANRHELANVPYLNFRNFMGPG